MSCDAPVMIDPTVSGGTLRMSAAAAEAVVRRVFAEGDRARSDSMQFSERNAADEDRRTPVYELVAR